jgi:predicted nucleic acid-binding protein
VAAVGWPPDGNVYADANVFVYYVEAIEPYGQRVRELFVRADRGEALIVTSMLTLAEVLVHPLRQRQDELVRVYQDLLLRVRAGLRVMPVDASVLIDAARVRAAVPSIRLPDAIHLATARRAGCDLVITNDTRLKAAPDSTVVVLSEC